MFIGEAWAQAAAPVSAGASITGSLIQIIGVFLVFYLLLIRPQQKKMKQHEAELKAIKIGDEVVTGGGLYAKVKAIKDDDIVLEIAKDVEVRVFRYTIREVLPATTSKKAETKKVNTKK